jgi:chromate transporter
VIGSSPKQKRGPQELPEESYSVSAKQAERGRSTPQASMRELALVFLKLGTVAFGGPAAHIAMMEDEFVTRRQWLTHEQFLDRLGAANLLPGPSSTEMAIFIGYEKGGWPGLVVAGCSFILPAAILVTLIAAAYVRYGSLPQVSGVLYALKPVVIAIIVQAFWKLGRSAVKSKWLAVVGVASGILYALRVQTVLILAIAATLAGIPALYRGLRGRRELAAVIFAPLTPTRMLAAAAIIAVPVAVWRLFLEFAKIGFVLFGSGYVLLAFLRADLVDGLHWLTERQLLDSVAVGQFTPGPVFTTATFIGYIVAGIPGALVATIGIFVPGFVFVALSGVLIPKIRQSRVAGVMLDGVVVGSLALMGVVAWQLGRSALIDIPTAVIAVVSTALLLRFRINSAWLIVIAGVFGFLYRR